MSWKLTGIVSQKKLGSTVRKYLLHSMCDKANDDGSGVYASFHTLAEMIDASRPTVKRIIKDFLDEGLITQVGIRPCYNGHTNEYAINVEAVMALPDIKPVAEKKATRVKVNRVHGEPGSPQTGVTATPDPVQGEPPTRVTMTPKPIHKPIQEPKTLPPPSSGEACGDLFGAISPSPKLTAGKKKSGPAYTPEFEAFWKSWPKARRELSDKRTAFRRWTDAQKRWETPTLMGAAKRYLSLPSVTKEDFRYCVLAEVFLNGKLDAAVEAFLDAVKPAETILPESTKLRYLEVTGKWREEWGPRPDGVSP